MSKSETLSAPVIKFLEIMGWRFVTTHATWSWVKFNSDSNPIFGQGGKCWGLDVEIATRLAVEDEPEVWVPTMELRQQFRHRARDPILQQKWTCGSGSSEWRDVGYVDQGGEPLV